MVQETMKNTLRLYLTLGKDEIFIENYIDFGLIEWAAEVVGC